MCGGQEDGASSCQDDFSLDDPLLWGRLFQKASQVLEECMVHLSTWNRGVTAVTFVRGADRSFIP